MEKAEIKYGEFTMTFKIPETYERKWQIFLKFNRREYHVKNGVLQIIYVRDIDDTRD